MDASEYTKYSGAQLVWIRELIANLNLRGDERILDLVRQDSSC